MKCSLSLKSDTHTDAYAHIHRHTYTHTYIHLQTQTDIDTQKHTHTHTHTHKHAHTYIHTHTLTLEPSNCMATHTACSGALIGQFWKGFADLAHLISLWRCTLSTSRFFDQAYKADQLARGEPPQTWTLLTLPRGKVHWSVVKHA